MRAPGLPAPTEVTPPEEVAAQTAAIEEDFGKFLEAEAAANRRKGRNPKRNQASLTGWKRKVSPLAKRLAAKYSAVAGYLLRRVMTKPKHIVDMKTVKGRVYYRLNGEKTWKHFGHLNTLGYWWERLKRRAKLTKSDMDAADRVFKRMVVKAR